MDAVVFGAGNFAALIGYCLANDSAHTPVAFTVNAAYRTSGSHNGLPLIDFEKLDAAFDPSRTAIAVAIGPHDGNRLRGALAREARSRGFSVLSYISSRCITWPDLDVGTNTYVFEGSVIQPFARIGSNCIIRNSVNISHHVTIEDDCFVAGGVCFGGGAIVRRRAFIGLGAIIRDNIEIGEGCVIGAGSVVTRSTEPDSTYAGVPARKVNSLKS